MRIGFGHCALSLVVVSAALCACSKHDDDGIPEGDRRFLEGWASRLAPSMVLPEGYAPSPPDTAGIGALIDLCDANPGYYVYFYACLKDSLAWVEPPEPVEQPDDTAAVELTNQADSLSGTAGRDPSTL